MIIKVTAEDVIKVAREWVNYPEKNNANNLESFGYAGSGNYTIFAKILDAMGDFYNGKKQGFAWCDVFVDCCIYLAADKDEDAALYILCQPRRSCGAGCSFSAQYYKQAGRWSTKPQVGAQIFFTYSPGDVSHTGLVESFTATTVTTIEGNAGDKVSRITYNINDPKIYGYGLPRYGEINSPSSGSNNNNNNIIVGSSCRVQLPELEYGSGGYAVQTLQILLIQRGFSCGSYGADGDFGNGTLNAVKKFQASKGLSPDGIVGAQTWAALLGGKKI